jgi:hypothetical protein
MKRLLQFIFGCRHREYGFPITLKDRNLTYRVCLECGAERKYDWQRMRFVSFERGEERKLRAANYGEGVIL